MLIQGVVVILLMIWASDKSQALGPAIAYAAISLAFAILSNVHNIPMLELIIGALVQFAVAFALFWLVTRTEGLIGWIVRLFTFLVLAGFGVFVGILMGK